MISAKRFLTKTKNLICYGFLTTLISFLSLLPVSMALTLEITNPDSGLVLSTDSITGNIDFGTVDTFGINQGNTEFVDGIFFTGSSNVLLNSVSSGAGSGSVYIIGTGLAKGAMKLTALDLSGGSADLSVSNSGDFNIYLSKSDTLWAAGTILNDSDHPVIAPDNNDVILKGSGGIFSDSSFNDSDAELTIDLAIKVPMGSSVGIKSNILTFTLVSN
jgi:hypothetical protein